MPRQKFNKDSKIYLNKENIAENIKLLRNIKGLTQEDIADYLHMSRSAYSKLENGVKMPNFMTLYALSFLYDVNLNYILYFDIPQHLMSLLTNEHSYTDTEKFILGYTKLSNGAKKDIEHRINSLLNMEDEFNML